MGTTQRSIDQVYVLTYIIQVVDNAQSTKILLLVLEESRGDTIDTCLGARGTNRCSHGKAATYSTVVVDINLF